MYMAYRRRIEGGSGTMRGGRYVFLVARHEVTKFVPQRSID